MNLHNLLLTKKLGGSGGSGVVVCEEEFVYTNHIVATSGILKVSLPNATRLCDTMFNGCKTLVEINAPKVNYIDSGCFGGCSSLTSVYLPKLNGVGLSVFARCTSLETIELPLLHTIESCTFGGCTNLTNIHLPHAKSVITNAFEGCVSLTKIELPCATNIDCEAFANCTNLFAVILRTTETVCLIQVDSFKNTKIMDENGMLTGEGFVYIPASMDAAYRSVYEPAFADLGMDGLFDILFRKIEDYPEICG